MLIISKFFIGNLILSVHFCKKAYNNSAVIYEGIFVTKQFGDIRSERIIEELDALVDHITLWWLNKVSS